MEASQGIYFATPAETGQQVSIPADICTEIFCRCDPVTQGSLSRTSLFWNAISHRTWKQAPPPGFARCPENISWKEFCALQAKGLEGIKNGTFSPIGESLQNVSSVLAFGEYEDASPTRLLFRQNDNLMLWNLQSKPISLFENGIPDSVNFAWKAGEGGRRTPCLLAFEEDQKQEIDLRGPQTEPKAAKDNVAGCD